MSKKIKTLANCKPTEFLKQTNKIRKSVENWVDVIDIVNLKNRQPKDIPAPLPKGSSKEDVVANMKKREDVFREQGRKNISEILDNAFEKYPEQTLEILALCAFVEPKNVDDYTMEFYLSVFNELIESEAVKGFFTSLWNLVLRDILDVVYK